MNSPRVNFIVELCLGQNRNKINRNIQIETTCRGLYAILLKMTGANKSTENTVIA